MGARRHPKRCTAALLRTSLLVTAWTVAQLSCPTGMGWAQQSPPMNQASSMTVGGAAKPFQLKTLEGDTVDLAGFRGKPLIINFFASWCDPCRDEMPLINDLATRGVRDGYSVLGIAVEDGRTAVLQYASEAKIAFPVALDTSSAVKRAYRIFGPPATFFIDAQGIVRDAVLGPLSAERARLAMQRAGALR
jgi:cytochrome c biogenesis protein CcmG/thiol:disulfide interchange protein DsbE